MKDSHKNKKQQKISGHYLSTLDKLTYWWKDKHPVLLFAFTFGAFMAVFYVIISLDTFVQDIHPQLMNLNANISSVILNLLGQNTLTSGSNIRSSLFSVDIRLGCDALEPIALFTAAVLAYPSALNKKLIGVIVAGLILFVINIIRIASLFLIGVYVESIFDLMHIEIWQFLFILFAIILFLFWIKWAIKPNILSPNA